MTFFKKAALVMGLMLPLPSALLAQQAPIVCQPMADGTPTMRVSELHGVNIAGVNPGNDVGAYWASLANQRNYGTMVANGHLADSFGVSPLIVPAIAGQTAPARLTVTTGQFGPVDTVNIDNDTITVGTFSGAGFIGARVSRNAPATGFNAATPQVLNVPAAVMNDVVARGLDSVRNNLILDMVVQDDTQVLSAELEYCVRAPVVEIDVLQCCMGIPEFEPATGPSNGFSVPRFYEGMPVTISVDSQFSQGFFLSVDEVDENTFDFATGWTTIANAYSGWVHTTSNRPANDALPTGFVVQNYTSSLAPGFYQIGVATGPAWVIDHTLFYVE